MLDSYKIRGQNLPHFITTTVVDWINVFREDHLLLRGRETIAERFAIVLNFVERGQLNYFKLIDKMLTNKKFKDLFAKNVATL